MPNPLNSGLTPLSDLPSLDPDRIFPTYLGSNALSPFHECYANEHTVLRRAVGRFFAHYNGDDPEQSYWALRRAAALFDVPERPVEISGPDAVTFLELLCARKIGDLKPGRGRYALLCTAEGGLFMDGILFRLEDDCFWFVQADGDLDTWLLAHRPGFDVTITDPQSRVLQIQGPHSFRIMHAATQGALDRDFKYFHAGFFRIGGQRVYISRTGWTGELGYEIYTLGANTDCPRLWQDLMTAGRPHGLVFSSMQAMNTRRIEAGILDNGSDFDVSMSPYDAGLGHFIDLDKDGFIGCGALQNIRQGNRLFGLRCDEAIPAWSDLVLQDQHSVGKVTTGARSPFLDCGIGYVRFDQAADWAGTSLTLRSQRFGDHPCEIVDLPFYDQDKKLPRGLG